MQAEAAAPPLLRTAAPKVDPREARARTDPDRFAILAAQLGAMVIAISVIASITDLPADVGAGLQGRRYLTDLLAFTLVGFCVHYWAPFRFKEHVWVGLSIAALLLLDVKAGALLVGAALAFYAVIISPLPYALRAGLVASAAPLVLIEGARRELSPLFVAAFGSVFAFRMIIYLYDAKHWKKRPSLLEYMSYFFMLPNWAFFFFPVVNLQTMRASYYQRDIHETAQIGLRWMARGVVQVAIFALSHPYFKHSTVASVTSFGKLAAHLVLFQLEYLWVSGTFHFAVGMMRLFGYALPETNRNWALAQSPMDLWRRMNIYWKDFQVKLFYYPLYFRLRKWNDKAAQLIAMAAVFPVTWALHVWLAIWLNWEWKLVQFRDAYHGKGIRGLFELHKLFGWMILGAFCVANLLIELRRKKKLPEGAFPKEWPARARVVLQIAGTAILLALVRRLLFCQSLGQFLDLIRI